MIKSCGWIFTDIPVRAVNAWFTAFTAPLLRVRLGVLSPNLNLVANPTNLLALEDPFILLLAVTTASYLLASDCIGNKPCLLKCIPNAFAGT